MEENGNLEAKTHLFYGPDRREAYLQHLIGQGGSSEKGSEDLEKTLRDTQKRVESNIESLDYLRGISCLERDFVHLADKVVQTSLRLSHDCRTINREALDSTQLADEVGNSWEHVTHLGHMLQTHVKHAKRYHLFHLELENLSRQLNELETHVEGLTTNQAITEAVISDFSTEVQRSLESLVGAFFTWQKLNHQLAIVSPLHRRMPLPYGLHGGVLLTSITLSSANGKVGRLLRAGTRVHVRANRPADLMHREWFLVDPLKDKEAGGLVIASVPAAFVWLDSPEASPERVTTGEEAVRRKMEVRRSQSASAMPQGPNNIAMVKDLRKHLCKVWKEACSRFDQNLRKMSILLLKDAFSSSQRVLSAEELTRVDKALQKVSEFAKIFESAHESGPESLPQRLADVKSRRGSRGENLNVDVNALNALVQAIEVFEELVICYQRYCSSETPEIAVKDEIEKDWNETEKSENMSKSSTESRQPGIIPVYAESFTARVPNKPSSRTSDSTKSLGSTDPKYRHKSPLVDGLDAENDCPHSPGSSGGCGDHSVSWISQTIKNDKNSRETQHSSRARRRDRLYRFLPILIRRQAQIKKSKASGDGESGLSDNEASRMKLRISSTSPKRLQCPFESLTLDRVNYMEKSDWIRLHRTPLLLSTSAFFASGDGYVSPTGASTFRQHQHRRRSETTKGRPLLYTVACQNGVCVTCKMTEIEHPITEEHITRKCGKKMQVGKSFTAQEFGVEGEKMEKYEGVTNMVGSDYAQASHVYANIDPQSVYSLEQAIRETTLYDIGVQADLPNRLRGLRCRLEFEQPGVELGDKGQLSCEAFKERFDTLSLKNVKGEGGGGGRDEAGRNFKTLSFRVAFGNKPARSASTI